jgi:hypothetical protein
MLQSSQSNDASPGEILTARTKEEAVKALLEANSVIRVTRDRTRMVLVFCLWLQCLLKVIVKF